MNAEHRTLSVATFWAGTNDLANSVSVASTWAATQLICQSLRAAGWYVIGINTLPRNEGGLVNTYAADAAALSLLAATGVGSTFDVLVDAAAMFPDPATYQDSVHLTAPQVVTLSAAVVAAASGHV